ncbi:MAG: DUF5069 domain-containing protein [Candidatus Latescibacterota bacterium]|nr:DUF5069 domain-containing protein [Candidatus Latescibacterota bacterium]
MAKQIPLISTRTKGPLGLAHLPRLWLKMRLSSKGQLDEEYRAGEGGFDGLLLEALGIESAEAIDYIGKSGPDYLTFETWIKENANPESLTPDAISAFNDRVLSFAKPEPGRTEMLELLGLPQSEKEWLGTDLNDLDDWYNFHLTLFDKG